MAFHNRQRIHTSLGGLSPANFELAALKSPDARRRSPLGIEPLRDGAKRTNGRGPQRATGAPLGSAAATTAQSINLQASQVSLPKPPDRLKTN